MSARVSRVRDNDARICQPPTELTEGSVEVALRKTEPVENAADHGAAMVVTRSLEDIVDLRKPVECSRGVRIFPPGRPRYDPVQS
jgi:hypothetical protein